MLTRLELRLFKCFELLRLPIAPLTLLSGPNSSGKSSVLQALVLLHQTMREHEWATRLALNGNGVRLGTVVDVVDEVHGRTGFELRITVGDTTCSWRFVDERRAMSLRVQRVSINEHVIDTPKRLRHLLPLDDISGASEVAERIRGLTYITAERLGPQEAYVLEDPADADIVGSRGEHATSVLHWRRDDPVIEELALAHTAPNLLQQVEARMRTIFPGCDINLQQLPRTNAVALGLRTSRETEFHGPIHTGFGLTQGAAHSRCGAIGAQGVGLC